MGITGNGSYGNLMIWTQDLSDGSLPRPWVAVYSAHTYHLIMLLWSLWLALRILPWSRLAVAALSSDGWFRPFFLGGSRRKVR